MQKAYSQKIWANLQLLYVEQGSWPTNRFKISDNIILHRFPGIQREKINHIIRSHSLLAEQKIEKKIKKGWNFYDAKQDIKFKEILPLLIKQHSWGWHEPTFEELSDDSKKRLVQSEKTYDFRKTRDDEIQDMQTQLIKIKDGGK